MTHVSLAPRARPNVVIAALTALNSSPPAAIADPKVIDAVPPRDLSGTYMSLGLDDHPGAVCVQVPKVVIDDKAALAILTGSTMNGQVLTEGDARKLLADDMADKKAYGTGETSAKRFNLKAGNNWLHIGRHVEPRRIAGTPINRGEHVAVH